MMLREGIFLYTQDHGNVILHEGFKTILKLQFDNTVT